MYKIKQSAAMFLAAAMIVAQPVAAYAAGPGDVLSPTVGTDAAEGSSSSASTTAGNVPTSTVPDLGSQTDSSAVSQVSQTTQAGSTSAPATGADQAVTSGSPVSSSTQTASASTSSITVTSGKVLPKIATDVDSVRAHAGFVLPGEGSPAPDPVLQLVPLNSYFIYDSNGTRLDYSSTDKSEGFAYAAEGFNRIMMEHQNVGRYYYRTYTSSHGWGPWAATKETTPDYGKVEAIQIRVKGYTHHMAEVYYKAVLNDGTVTDWAVGGQACGSMGTGKYIVALKMALWKQDVSFPASTEKPLDNSYSEGVYKDGSGVHYSTHDGSAYTGWGYDQDSNGYYFENGQAVTGWHAVNGYNLYFDSDGKVLKDLSGIMGNPGVYQIRINKATRTMYVMTKDSSGNFTIPYKTLMITVGTDTPIGTFHIYQQYRWKFMHEGCYCQFLSRFYNGFLIHSLLYDKPNSNALDAIYYNYMDVSMSGGCIRLRAVDCGWIYNNCKNGTEVTIYSDPWDKGPVEKDAIEQAIPRDQTYDPTDPVITAQQAADQSAAQQAEAEAAQGITAD